MNIALSILATAMLLSFSAGLTAMVYDATSKRGLTDQEARVVTIIYLWPVAIVGGGVLVSGIAAIWGLLP